MAVASLGAERQKNRIGASTDTYCTGLGEKTPLERHFFDFYAAQSSKFGTYKVAPLPHALMASTHKITNIPKHRFRYYRRGHPLIGIPHKEDSQPPHVFDELCQTCGRAIAVAVQ